MNDNIFVINSIFHDFTKKGCGGIFELSSVKLQLTCCIFESISSSSYGGCIYATNSHISLNGLSFQTCFITKSEDELFGNIMYINNQQKSDSSLCSILDQISFSKCGEKRKNGDSSICLNFMQYEVTNMNSSWNGGTMGSSLFSGYNSLDNSFIKFSQDSNSTCYISILSYEEMYECSFCNFIYTTGLINSIVWSEPENVITLRSCIFYNSHDKLYSKSCIFYDCQSDKNFPEISKILNSLPQLNEVIGYNKQFLKLIQTLPHKFNVLFYIKQDYMASPPNIFCLIYIFNQQYT